MVHYYAPTARITGPALDTGGFGRQKTMRSYFILTAVDSIGTTSSGAAAHEIALQRLAKGLWPLYKGTQNRNAIAQGDRVLVYVGGKNRYKQSFVAMALVSSVEPVARRLPIIDSPAIVTDAPFKVVHLKQITYFEPPIELRPFIGRLDFLPSTTKWGASLAGGCRRLPVCDFRKILRASGQADSLHLTC